MKTRTKTLLGLAFLPALVQFIGGILGIVQRRRFETALQENPRMTELLKQQAETHKRWKASHARLMDVLNRANKKASERKQL
jgi:uncharacterized protein YneF (UPF0154 family)